MSRESGRGVNRGVDSIMRSSRAEMGIGTLILFISALLAVAVAAGVLIQTNSSLQEKALTVGQQAKDGVITSFNMVSIVGEGPGRNNLTNFKAIVRLSPGSTPINFESVLLSVSTPESSATYSYKGASANISNDPTGYSLFLTEEYGALGGSYSNTPAGFINGFSFVDIGLDLDFDGVNERVIMCQDGVGTNPCNGNATASCEYLYLNMTNSTPFYLTMNNAAGAQVNTAGASADIFSNNLTAIGDIGRYSTTGVNSGGCGIGPNKVTFFAKESELDDFDEDGKRDYFYFDETDIIFVFSDGGITSIPLGVDLSAGGQVLNLNTAFPNSTANYGTLILSGTTSRANYVNKGVNVTIIPTKEYHGFFVAEVIQQATNHQNGIIRSGDMYRIYIEPPNVVSEGESATLKIIPKTGAVSTHDFNVPEVISSTEVAVYPIGASI